MDGHSVPPSRWGSLEVPVLIPREGSGASTLFLSVQGVSQTQVPLNVGL